MSEPIVRAKWARLAMCAAIIASSGGAIIWVALRDMDVRNVMYYTIQSNFVLCVVYILKLVSTARGKHEHPWLYGFALATILPTYLFMVFYLGPTSQYDQLVFNPEFFMHYVAPPLAIVDWVLFTRHGKCRWHSAATWMAMPALYYVLSLVVAECRLMYFNNWSRYAYEFLNDGIMKLRDPAQIPFAVLTVVGFLAVNAGLVLIDKLLGKRRERVKTV